MDHETDAQAQPFLNRRALLAGGVAVVGGVIVAAASSGAARAQAAGQPVALITGSSRGFGRLTAETMAKNGYHVIASMRDPAGRNAQAARELTELARRDKLKIDVVEIDVDNDASVETGVARALQIGRKIDVLVNNAGIIVPGPVEISMESARRQFETNVFGQMRMLRAVAPGMREARSGFIVHVSSGLGRFVMPTNGVYCATKFATEAMMEAAAYELHPFGVEVAIVQPGAFSTNFKPAGRAAFNDMVANLSAADKRRAEAYAAHMRITMERMADGPTLPTQLFADTVLKLAQTPAGQRPLRTPAMPEQQAEGINRLNATLEGIQQTILQRSGMGDWLTLRI